MTDEPIEPIPYLPYATPVTDPLPGSVRAIAIVGICMAGITILQRFFGIISASAMLAMKSPMFSVGYSIYQIASGGVFMLFAVLLLAASIGCLRRKQWGRTCILGYAMTYPVVLVADAAGIVLIVAPATSQMMAKAMATTSPATPMPINMSSMMDIMMIAQAVVGVVILMILPCFILVTMRKPAVRAAFAMQ